MLGLYRLVNIRRSLDIGLMGDQRRRRFANINPALDEHLILAKTTHTCMV